MKLYELFENEAGGSVGAASIAAVPYKITRRPKHLNKKKRRGKTLMIKRVKNEKN